MRDGSMSSLHGQRVVTTGTLGYQRHKLDVIFVVLAGDLHKHTRPGNLDRVAAAIAP